MRTSPSLRTSLPGPADTLEPGRAVERTRAARDDRLDDQFVGDHHVTGPAPSFQKLPLFARLIGECHAGPIGALVLVPLWHPVSMAEQVGKLAARAERRLVALASICGGAAQFEAAGGVEFDRIRRFQTRPRRCRPIDRAARRRSDTAPARGPSVVDRSVRSHG